MRSFVLGALVLLTVCFGTMIGSSSARADNTWMDANSCFVDQWDFDYTHPTATGSWLFRGTILYQYVYCSAARISSAGRLWTSMTAYFEKFSSSGTRRISCRAMTRDPSGGQQKWGTTVYSGTGPGFYALNVPPPTSDSGPDTIWTFSCSIPFSSATGVDSAEFLGYKFYQL
jgi:hypothetical protein